MADRMVSGFQMDIIVREGVPVCIYMADSRESGRCFNGVVNEGVPQSALQLRTASYVDSSQMLFSESVRQPALIRKITWRVVTISTV
jgi:hypothetical protein